MSTALTTTPRTVLHYTDTRGFGGAERMLLTTLSTIDRARWRPMLMLHDGPGIAPLAAEANALGVPTHLVPPMTRRRGTLRLPGFVRAVRRLRPALFHAHLVWPLRCVHALVGASLSGIPTLATQQLYVPLPSRHEELGEKLFSLVVDRYVAVSRDMQRLMRERVLFAQRVIVIPNSVRTTPLAEGGAAAVRRTLLGERDAALVLTLARLDEHKGLLTLVRCAAEVSNAVFAIAGEGPQRAHLEEEIRARGLGERVLLLGHRTDVPDLLAACDLFVLPSLFEGLSVSLLEAMAARKPVVASDIGGNNEVVVDGETGVLVPPGDPMRMASAVRQVLGDAPYAHRLAAAGRERVGREFSAEAVGRRVTEVYEELLGERAPYGEGRRPEAG
jgi:glycosyltransferase involved in cell wall biosynthesis